MSFEKIFCWVVCLFFMAMPAMSVSFTIGDFKYDVTDTTGLTVSVSAASDTISGKVTIPDKIEYEGKEYSVTAIGEGAFKKCAGLTSVIIPNTVASIGKDALHVDTVCCLTESDTIRIIRDTLFIHNLQEFISYKILAAKGVYMNAILEADIDLSSVCGVINGEQISWTPIRMSSGSFDGGNHTISNLYINQPNNKDNLALFDTGGCLSYLRIKNLKVTNAYVKGGGDVAGIAIDGFFINCHFEGIVIGKRAGGVNEYGKVSDAYNCSNYGLIVSSEYSIGVAADNMYNCYNRGRIVSDKSVAGSYTAAVGLGMYCCTQFNLYNAGDVYSPDPNSIRYIQTSSSGSDYGNLFALQQMDSVAFISGAVTDSLNMYVSQNPKVYSYVSDSVPLLSWVQGEDGFPRFEGVDLQPTQGYVVHFKGAINDYEVSLDGTIALPVCSVKGRSYVFSDNFDGKNIVSDTVVTVEMIGEAKKDSIWGLDMSDIANIDTSGYITLSFYSNVERERVYGIGGDFFYNNELSSYFYTNTYSSKAGVTCDYVQENDSVYKITLHNVYFNSNKHDSLLIWMEVEHYNQKSNILKWEKKDTTQSLPVSGQIAGHDYIDLGLPSGTLWATYNVGATKPTEFGDYFAWGETELKDVYDWNTYKYCTAYFNEFDLWKLQSITKYNFGNEYTGTIDNQSILLSEDDAATANWGKEWVMPTIDDLKELSSECYIVWTNDYSGAKGIIVYKAKRAEDKGQRVESTHSPSADYSIADAHIFLPAQGFREGLDILNVGSDGGYWLSSLNEKEESHSYLYLFSNENGYWEGYFSNRYLGCPVRAVSKPEASEVSDIISQALQVYVANQSIYVVDAQPNAKIQVFEMNGKIVASGTTDAKGSAEINHSASKGVYVVTDGNQSTKVVIK